MEKRNREKKLKVNKIQCNHCGDIIESTSSHDYKRCSCGAVGVDGGLDYIRRDYKNAREDFIELSEYYEEKEQSN
ncbi:MAG: hypothetical protein EOM50_02395 [Erysipelotrichia bacterium]|nr:hypothetical protein [Erysipelotrichia bacterium]NCC54804.1 hypothetical protein [Erysipelotrichia bacterium]